MNPIKHCRKWYKIQEIKDNVFWINEPGHVSFYVLRLADKGLFVDSGLGLSNDLGPHLYCRTKNSGDPAALFQKERQSTLVPGR